MKINIFKFGCNILTNKKLLLKSRFWARDSVRPCTVQSPFRTYGTLKLNTTVTYSNVNEHKRSAQGMHKWFNINLPLYFARKVLLQKLTYSYYLLLKTLKKGLLSRYDFFEKYDSMPLNKSVFFLAKWSQFFPKKNIFANIDFPGRCNLISRQICP